MRVLAIDTALAACSAAVLDTAVGGIIASESESMARGHAEALMPLLARVMKRARLAFGDLERVAVTIGPGSFTGLRVGLAAARGLGVATTVPLVGVSTLSAYAAPYLDADDKSPLVVAIDARHDHVYLQVFAAGERSMAAPQLAPLKDAVRAASHAPARIVGSSAQAIADRLPKTAFRPLTIDTSGAPDIAWVAKIGAVAALSPSPPKPLYLRAADAHPQHAAQLPRR